MKQLIDDYKRKIKALNEMILHNKPDELRTTKLETKLGCYKSFLSELEKEHDYIKTLLGHRIRVCSSELNQDLKNHMLQNFLLDVLD